MIKQGDTEYDCTQKTEKYVQWITLPQLMSFIQSLLSTVREMSITWCNGLYSYSYNGQVVKTVDILDDVGFMAAPGEDNNQEERGKMSFRSGQFSDVDTRGLEITGEDFYNVEIVYVIEQSLDTLYYHCQVI